MSVWNKKVISKDELEKFRSKYGLDSLSASIMLRRGITQGKDILYFMEDDLRFQHSPFSFNSMEDAVDRIYTSPIYEKLSDASTGLFFQSPRYVLSYL